MTVYNSVETIPKDERTVLTVGTFDGLHLGHQRILKTVVEKARALNGRSLVITFERHPRLVLYPESRLKLLLTGKEKISVAQSLGIDAMLVLQFDYDFSRQSSEDFFRKYIIDKIGISEIIIGHDHRFGKDRDGDENLISALSSQHNFGFSTVGAVTQGDETVSSSRIRQYLEVGDVGNAARMLGYQYSFTGTVTEGDKRGRTIGFPTANITVDDRDKLIPANGVYAVRITVDGAEHKGVMNIGVRPTFQESNRMFCEVHILNFEGDLYGKTVKVTCIDRLRDEKKFNSADELVKQIKIDSGKAAELLM